MQVAEKSVRAPNPTNAREHPPMYHRSQINCSQAMLYLNKCLGAKLQMNTCCNIWSTVFDIWERMFYPCFPLSTLCFSFLFIDQGKIPKF